MFLLNKGKEQNNLFNSPVVSEYVKQFMYASIFVHQFISYSTRYYFEKPLRKSGRRVNGSGLLLMVV